MSVSDAHSTTEETEDEPTCDSCGYSHWRMILHKTGETWGDPATRRTLMLCDICYSTFVGRAARYPSQYAEQLPVMQVIAYVGNAILDKLEDMRMRTLR